MRVYCRDGSYLEGKFIQRTKNKRLILDTGEVPMRNVARAIEIKYEPVPMVTNAQADGRTSVAGLPEGDGAGSQGTAALDHTGNGLDGRALSPTGTED